MSDNPHAEVEADFVKSLIGPDAVPEAIIAIVQYVSADGQSLHSVYYRIDDITVPQALGLVELAKYDIMGDNRVGWADSHWRDDDA